jgi:hypothetical protein
MLSKQHAWSSILAGENMLIEALGVSVCKDAFEMSEKD